MFLPFLGGGEGAIVLAGLKEKYAINLYYVSSIWGCQKGTPFFIGVAPVGNWRDNTQLPGYTDTVMDKSKWTAEKK